MIPRFRLAIYNAFVTIHKAGVQHDDLAERNIVVRPNGDGYTPTIIDFERACKHTCRVKKDTIQPYTKRPPECEHGCHELYLVAREASIWIPGKYLFIKYAIQNTHTLMPFLEGTCVFYRRYVDEIALTDAQLMLERYPPPEDVPMESARVRAEEIIERFKEWRDERDSMNLVTTKVCTDKDLGKVTPAC